MVAFRLICDLLHCHVSDAKSPLAAISFRAAKLGCSRSGMASSLMVRRKPCMGSRVLGDPAADARATVSSSNHVGRRVLTPISSGDCINLTFSRRKLW